MIKTVIAKLIPCTLPHPKIKSNSYFHRGCFKNRRGYPANAPEVLGMTQVSRKQNQSSERTVFAELLELAGAGRETRPNRRTSELLNDVHMKLVLGSRAEGI